MVDTQCLYTGTLSALETWRIGSIGNGHRDRGVEAPVTNGIGECL
jgi:hypothetical protein